MRVVDTIGKVRSCTLVESAMVNYDVLYDIAAVSYHCIRTDIECAVLKIDCVLNIASRIDESSVGGIGRKHGVSQLGINKVYRLTGCVHSHERLSIIVNKTTIDYQSHACGIHPQHVLVAGIPYVIDA